MKRDAAESLQEALALPTEARAALAGSLLDSLDTDVDEDAEAAWAIEVNRRVVELDSGAVKTIPWAEVRRRLAARMPPVPGPSSIPSRPTKRRLPNGGTANGTRPRTPEPGTHIETSRRSRVRISCKSPW
jgi:putative addiction module component (TIGR02574 family)